MIKVGIFFLNNGNLFRGFGQMIIHKIIKEVFFIIKMYYRTNKTSPES